MLILKDDFKKSKRWVIFNKNMNGYFSGFNVKTDRPIYFPIMSNLTYLFMNPDYALYIAKELGLDQEAEIREVVYIEDDNYTK